MMFEAMFFLFCPIHIKHQTFNFKLKKGAVFIGQRLFVHYYLLQENVLHDEDDG